MNQAPLKFAVAHFNTKIETDPTNENIIPGFMFRIADVLHQGLGLPYEIVSVFHGEGQYPNGTWAGTIGMVRQNKADLGIAPIPVTEGRSSQVNFSFPVLFDFVTFATLKTENAPEISAIFRPFGLGAWITLLISSFVMVLIIYGALGKKDFPHILNNIFCSLLQQSVAFKYRGEKWLMFTWFLGVMFLTSCYLSLLLSFLTFPPLNKVRDITRLSREVEEGNYRVLIPDANTMKVLYLSLDRKVKVIGDTVWKNNESFADLKMFIDMSKRINVAYVGKKDLLDHLEGEYYISKDYFAYTMSSFTISKNFCCKEKLNILIHRLTAAGIFRRLIRDPVSSTSLSLYLSPYLSLQDSQKPITIFHLAGAFIILAVGLTLSCIVFIIEILTKRCKKRCNLRKILPKKIGVKCQLF